MPDGRFASSIIGRFPSLLRRCFPALEFVFQEFCEAGEQGHEVFC